MHIRDIEHEAIVRKAVYDEGFNEGVKYASKYFAVFTLIVILSYAYDYFLGA